MLELNHGGHVLAEDAPGAKSAKKQGHRLMKKVAETTTPFEYLLPALKNRPQAHLPGDPAKVSAVVTGPSNGALATEKLPCQRP